MDWLTQIAKEYGLFVALVVYVLWEGRNRELRYISIIDKLSKSFTELKKDVEQIRKWLEKEKD